MNGQRRRVTGGPHSFVAQTPARHGHHVEPGLELQVEWVAPHQEYPAKQWPARRKHQLHGGSGGGNSERRLIDDDDDGSGMRQPLSGQTSGS